MLALAAGSAAAAAGTGCGPRRAGGADRDALPPPQGDALAATAAVEAPPIWKAGVRPPAQGSVSKLGAPLPGSPGGPASGAPASGRPDGPPDASGLSGLSLDGGEGPRDVGPVHVDGGPGLPDGLLGAPWERIVFPAAPLGEERTGIAVNVRHALEWNGVAVELEIQHRLAKDRTARSDRYVQRYWIHPARPIALAEAVAKLPPLGALARLAGDFGVALPAPGKDDPGGVVIQIVALRTSALATAIGYGYAVPRYGAAEYRLFYELLLDPATPPGPAALVREIAVDVTVLGTSAAPLGSWKALFAGK